MALRSQEERDLLTRRGSGLARAAIAAARGTAVRVVCGRCRRRLDVLHEEPVGWHPAAQLRDLRDAVVAVGARRYSERYRCRCGGEYPVRFDNLAAAYRVAAGRPPRERVIMLPMGSA